MTSAQQTSDQNDTITLAVKQGLDAARKALLVCELLEELADDLPNLFIAKWRTSQSRCVSVLYPYFVAVNADIIPGLISGTINDQDRHDVLVRLKTDCSDQLHEIPELEDLIADVLEGTRTQSEPETLGFALRGHFAPLRRNLKWQTDVLWPMAARSWSTQDANDALNALRSNAARG